jgi:hypothetical protein
MAARHAVRPRSGGSFHCHKHPPPKLLQSAPLGDVYPELAVDAVVHQQQRR